MCGVEGGVRWRGWRGGGWWWVGVCGEGGVDFNTVQVTKMDQFHNFVSRRLLQVSFQFDSRSRSMFTVPLLTTVCKTHPYSFLKLF